MRTFRAGSPGAGAAIAAAAVLAAVGPHAAGQVVIAESDFDDGPQGWTFTVSAEWRGSGGNPGGFMFGAVFEPTNAASVAFAPSAFLGDWSGLGSDGRLEWDYRRFSNGAGVILEISPVTAGISGPGGVALWRGPVVDAPGPWMSLVTPIRESDWIVTSGTWAGLIADVAELRITMEPVSNGGPAEDENGVDNVRLIADQGACAADLDGNLMVDVFDLRAYLDLWFIGDAAAERTGDDPAMIDVFDLLAYLDAWFAGC